MITLQEYFREYQRSFWNWRDQTEVITLSDDDITLVYKDYLIEVLEGLSLIDTPPLDCVLLALAATKPHSTNTLHIAKNNIIQLLYGGLDDNLEVPKGFDFLEILQQLPPSYHQDKERLFLLQTIFTNCYQAFSKENMQKILSKYKNLTNESFEQLVRNDGSPMNPRMLFHTLHILKLLAERFGTVEDLLNVLEAAKNLEAPILDEPTENTNPNWRQQLVEEIQTFYMATLLPNLQAGLALPSLKRLQQQEAFGGTADLSNKGELDRLLISEFAHDKILFLSRLVNKEALYRQREGSPNDPSLTRHILIDTSIYNWGSIKQIAFGIALALEQAEEDNIHSFIYALGQEVELLAWNSVMSVTKELNKIDSHLHAAKGLEVFFKKHKTNNTQEVILISSEDAVQHPAMSQVMRQYQQQLHYWIAPTAQGKITVYQYHLGKKVIQEFQLSLADAWHSSKVPTKKINEEELDLQIGSPPILMPEPKHYEQLLWNFKENTPVDVFMLTNHGYILRHYKQKKKKQRLIAHGWEWLYSSSLKYTLVEVGQHSSGDFMLLAAVRSPSRLDLINLSTQKQMSIDLPQKEQWHLKHFVYKEDVFYAIDNNKDTWIVEIQPNPVLCSFSDRQMVENLKKEYDLLRLKESSREWVTKHYQILKNVNTISITDRGHLLFNGRHELKLTQRKVVKIEARTSSTVISALQDYNKKHLRHFTFPDGSTIMTNALGLMILTSSNEDLPKIYLPVVLNKSLGMATKDHFCGNPYYFKKEKNLELVTPDFFFATYLKPFIDTIIE